MNYELMDNGVAKISLANGKVNALNKSLSTDLLAALDRAEVEAKAVMLCGSPGMFTAGFDLKVAEQSVEAATEMFLEGFALLEKIYSHPQPVVVACEGHAIGMGVFILLAADFRIGAKGKFVFKLPETEIGLPFSQILKILAKTHIDPRHHSQAIIQSRAYDSDMAATIGILDESIEAENVLTRAMEKAEELGALPSEQYKINKRYIRADEISLISRSRGLD